MDRPRIISIVLSLLAASLVSGCHKSGFDELGGTSFLIQVKPVTGQDGRVKAVSKESVDQVIAILEHRLPFDGVRIRPVGTDRVEVQVPGLQAGLARERIITAGMLDFRLVHPRNGQVDGDAGYVKLPVRQTGSGTDEKELLVKDHADMEGRHLTQAFTTVDPVKGWIIILKFSKEDAKLFGEFTGSHRGERLAIVVDGAVISAPVLREAITGGTAEITGSFTESSARLLAAVLDNPLPTPLLILQEGTVPPSASR